MKRTYEQDLQELNITAEEFDNIISHIYDKTADEMVVLAKCIRGGAKVLPAVKRAFERVLDMRGPEIKEAYEIYYTNLNASDVEKIAMERHARHGRDASGK